jgi:Domain of unknown function (DUF4159)/Aerotolerance regulator N-terminal
MFGLPLAFTVPLVLAALAALPVLYWLLKMTPPPPQRAVLPTLSIVRDMEARQETPAHTPWWLLLLRLLLAALIVLAMAGPLWNPDRDAPAGRGPLLVVVDNSWSAAPDWTQRVERAQALIETAGAAGRPVALRAVSEDPIDIVPAAATRALEQLRGLLPVPHALDRKRHEPPIANFLERNPEGTVVWLSDRVSVLSDAEVIKAIVAKAGDRVTVIAADKIETLALAAPVNAPEALTVKVLRASDASSSAGTLRATDARGRIVAETRFLFSSGAMETTARFEVPLEIRNDVARIDLVEQQSAGAVQLLDGRNKRRRVGVVSGESVDTAQPLLSPTYFITRALGPFADVREPPRGAADSYSRLIEDGATVLVLTDVAVLSGPTLNKLRDFVESGGVLIRFASRRTANSTDALMPVRLRRNERIMGGALSWETPKRLASFTANSPFDGLRIPEDVTVSQQVLAEPDATLSEKTWAALEDGTPLITGEKRGKGFVVLYHVTADSGWSSLPLSVAFVDTLRRLTGLSVTGDLTAKETDNLGTNAANQQNREAALALAPLRNLDAFGAYRPPPVTAEPVNRNSTETASQKHPPGFYGLAEAPLALNTLGANAQLKPVELAGIAIKPLTSRAAVDLRPHLITAALLLFLADALASLWLSGAFTRFRRSSAATAAFALVLVLVEMVYPQAGWAQLAPSTPSVSQSQTVQPRVDRIPSFRADDIEAALTTRLAYIITGDREVDEISRQGLLGLSRALSTRTSLDPAEPIGIDPARDEMVFYPLLYWPMVPNRPAVSEAAIRKVDAFMKGGGTVIFDTRDALNARGGNTTTPETRLLRQILAGINVPDLEPIPKDHVITKTFYILDGFVGRYAGGQNWIELLQRNQDQDRTRPAQAGDRVSPLIITGNDLAAAWAIDRNGQPRFPLVPGDARQRELAIRGGINIVMYAMTGNYKADQVHVPALLERLGQ